MKKKISIIVILSLFVLLVTVSIMFTRCYLHETEISIEDFEFHEGKPYRILVSEDSEYKIEFLFLWEGDSLTHHQTLYKKNGTWISVFQDGK